MESFSWSSVQGNGPKIENQDEHESSKDIERGKNILVDSSGEEIPCISVSWSLSPTVHPYTNDLAPKLRLVLTSYADNPITIYNESLSPGRMLSKGKFRIFDLTSNQEVQQSKTRFCDFEPPSKVEVPLWESFFILFI